MNLITVALIFIPVEIAVRLLSRSASDTAIFLNEGPGSAQLGESRRDQPGDSRQSVRRSFVSRLRRDARMDRRPRSQWREWAVSIERRRPARCTAGRGPRGSEDQAPHRHRRRLLRVRRAGGVRGLWGHLLEASSGGKFEVLNFGVGGYSIDQAYLRVKKDVLAWQPDVVILGFPLADLHRTLTVYPFISSPHWGIPFSKPRIVRDGNALRILNVPTIDPRVMFAQQSIEDLPFLEYDAGYSPPTMAAVKLRGPVLREARYC